MTQYIGMSGSGTDNVSDTITVFVVSEGSIVVLLAKSMNV